MDSKVEPFVNIPELHDIDHLLALDSEPDHHDLTASSHQVPLVNFPAVEKWPGKYKFTVHCNSKKQTFSSQLNTLFVAMQTKFAVEFDIADDDRMTPNHQMSVRTVVSYAEPADRETFGPVQPCACNVHVKDRKPEYNNSYLVSASAKYGEVQGHTTVTVDLADMHCVSGRYTACYSYASYTSCLSKGAKVATVFSLMDGEVEKGRDLFYCSVCACPQRDITRAVTKHMSQQDQKTRKSSVGERMASPVSASPLSVSDSDSTGSHTGVEDQPSPNGAGCYVFSWELRDREMYRHLCGLKRRYQEMEQRTLDLQRKLHHSQS